MLFRNSKYIDKTNVSCETRLNKLALFKNMPSNKRKFGDFGEKLAVQYLESKGYRIVDQNFQRPWGEIDIVARTRDLLVFCEVKTRDAKNVEHYLAEYSVNRVKIRRLQKMCETYLMDKRINDNQKWRIDVIAIAVDEQQGKARLKHYKNAVWEKQY